MPHVRKYLVIFITMVYTTLSVGIHLHLHYCCGKLADIHLTNATHNCCDTSEHNHGDCSLNNHCCSDENIKVSIDDKHQPSQFKINFASALLVKTEPELFPIAVAELSGYIAFFGANNDPPQKLPVYLMQQSLLFYA